MAFLLRKAAGNEADESGVRGHEKQNEELKETERLCRAEGNCRIVILCGFVTHYTVISSIVNMKNIGECSFKSQYLNSYFDVKCNM